MLLDVHERQTGPIYQVTNDIQDKVITALHLKLEQEAFRVEFGIVCVRVPVRVWLFSLPRHDHERWQAAGGVRKSVQGLWKSCAGLLCRLL